MKPESQKKRDKKKTEKRRKIQKAKRAAAPKNKDWKPDPVLEALKQSTIFQKVDSGQYSKERSQTYEADDTGAGSDALTDAQVLGDKEKKQKEKREKRERRQRKEERKARREVAITKMGIDMRPAEGTMAAEEIPGPEQAEEPEENKSAPSLVRSPTPPPLVPFPLPRSAPAPDTSVLARQGLPKGLEDATFIDQSLRIEIEGLHVEGQDQVLSVNMRRRLKDIGVEDFFAGRLPSV